jgi:hypothetical protein
VDRDSSTGTATRYGLDGPGIKSRWEARFSAPVQTSPGAHPASSTTGTGSFPGVKRPGRGVDHPPHLAPRLNSRAIILLHFWAFVAFSRVNFTFSPSHRLTAGVVQQPTYRRRVCWCSVANRTMTANAGPKSFCRNNQTTRRDIAEVRYRHNNLVSLGREGQNFQAFQHTSIYICTTRNTPNFQDPKSGI